MAQKSKRNAHVKCRWNIPGRIYSPKPPTTNQQPSTINHQGQCVCEKAKLFLLCGFESLSLVFHRNMSSSSSNSNEDRGNNNNNNKRKTTEDDTNDKQVRT
jgi:hypothetical protein